MAVVIVADAAFPVLSDACSLQSEVHIHRARIAPRGDKLFPRMGKILHVGYTPRNRERSTWSLMKLYHLLFFAALAAPRAQTPDSHLPDSQATLDYIHAAWDTLTRSATDCTSLVDVKVAAAPVLYLPADFAPPPAATALEQKCHVRVMHLPRPIQKLADVRPDELPVPGLLFLPNPYVVPGGRFNEMYGWDSYFIVLGLEADHREALAKDIVDNFLFEVENYGAVLNANRTYYLTRSQPPFLTSMIRVGLRGPGKLSRHGRRPYRGTGLARARVRSSGERLLNMDAA